MRIIRKSTIGVLIYIKKMNFEGLSSWELIVYGKMKLFLGYSACLS